jgi:hypothetical protein
VLPVAVTAVPVVGVAVTVYPEMVPPPSDTGAVKVTKALVPNVGPTATETPVGAPGELVVPLPPHAASDAVKDATSISLFLFTSILPLTSARDRLSSSIRLLAVLPELLDDRRDINGMYASFDRIATTGKSAGWRFKPAATVQD